MFFFFFERLDADLLYKIKVVGKVGWQEYFTGEIVDTHVKYFRNEPFFITTLNQTRIVKERTNYCTTGFKVGHHNYKEREFCPFTGFYLEGEDWDIVDAIEGDWTADRITQNIFGTYDAVPRGCH